MNRKLKLPRGAPGGQRGEKRYRRYADAVVLGPGLGPVLGSLMIIGGIFGRRVLSQLQGQAPRAGAGIEGGRKVSERNQADPIRELVELDKLILEPRRFGIMNALDRAGDLGFITLRRLTGLTQDNLDTHLRKLEEAGLIEISKRTFLSRPYSRVYITDAGRDAWRSHWQERHAWRPANGVPRGT